MEEMECSEEFLELAHKMRAEQEEYRVWLMSQPPEIIIAHAAEWSAREDVLSRLDELVLDGKETKALLSLDKPFEKLLDGFRMKKIRKRSGLRLMQWLKGWLG